MGPMKTSNRFSSSLGPLDTIAQKESTDKTWLNEDIASCLCNLPETLRQTIERGYLQHSLVFEIETFFIYWS